MQWRVQMERNSGEKVVATNRKARHEYFIVETYEAGIALTGTEVKSVREGKMHLQDSYATIDNGEVILHDVHISPYERRGYADHDPKRDRRLLLHKKEIRKLLGKTTAKGMTLIPLRVYFKGGHAKVELALARGKRQYDKREAIAQRDMKREMERRHET
jgi:SsrA-binding protein